MMNYFSNRKKWMAYLILLTFVFTCIVPTNLAGGNSEAWADTGISTVQAADIPGVTVKVFNYGADTNENGIPDVNETNLAKKGYVFFHQANGPYELIGKDLTQLTDNQTKIFNNLSELEKDALKAGTLSHQGTYGSVDGLGDVANNTYNRPVMKTQLVNNYPEETDYSLSYLFDETYLKGTMGNGGGLFQLQNGYYVYNSANNAAYYNAAANKFDVYNVTVVPYYNDADDSGHGGNFLPFNKITNETVEDRTVTEASGEATYRLMATSPVDNWYGMTVEFKFMMPADGKWNDEDMVFNFSGDDDVWVYIDNKLVMDMGGTHGVHEGWINFAEGETWYEYNEVDANGETIGTLNTTKEFSSIFDASELENGGLIDYTEHTFKFFYMERGGNISNCSISFNMPVNTTERTVTKVWDDDNNRDGVRPDSVTVRLTGDNDYTTTSALSYENNWTVTWSDLPKYHGLDGKDKNGQEIVYTVEELDSDGKPIPNAGGQYNDKYTTTYSTIDLTTTITNTYEPETISVEGTKHWEHGDNPEANWPDKITVNLYSDENGDFAWIDSQVVTGSSWTFKFDNLPKYKNQGTEANPDIEEIHYRVFEDEVPFYQPVYDKDSYDITNVYTENATPYVTIGGEKIWQGDEKDLSKRPEKVKVGLFQNNSVDPIATTFTALDWTFYFDEQPRYDDNGKPYVYTVKELDVPEGYISMTEEDRNDITYDFAFDITNILHTGEVGKVKVKKVVSGDGAPESFDFVLSVKAQKYNLSDEVTTERGKLGKAYQDAVTAESEAQKDWNDAVDAFKRNAGAYSTSSAYQFVLVRQTSPSAYQFTMLDKNNRMEVTTSSAMTLFDATDKLSDSDSILKTVANAIGSLADDFKDVTGKASLFLKSLKEALGDTIDAAIEFQTDDVNALLTAQSQLFDAKVRVDATSSAVYEFVQSNTTPSAVTIITKDGSGVEETHNMTLDKLSDVDTYRLYFSLQNNQEYAATILAAEGVELDYTVWEDLSKTDKANYEKTIVELNGNKVGEFTTGNPSYTEDLTDAEVADLVFTNYYDPDDPWTPPTPDPEDPPEKKEQTPDPETTIPDENVPTGSVEPGEPLDEFDEPEIPLGDAPATGDNTNAVPFMALMMFAIAGLVITRRTFN